MLCQFSVKNYQCLKDEITFDMQAVNISEHENSLIVDADGEKFLPLAAIYGPNGSGKSTVLDAFYSLVCKIMRPICAVGCDNKECAKHSGESAVTPFKFSKYTVNQPTEFELFFRTKKHEYQYIIVFQKEKVLREELYKKAINGSRYSLLFKRTGVSAIELRGSFKAYSCEDISDNVPLLSFLGITHRKNAIIKEVVGWFENDVHFINYSNPDADARIGIVSSGKVKSLVLKMMSEMDIDISNYRTEKLDEKLKVYTSHLVDDEEYELELFEESNGTIKIFGILPHIAQSILYGTTLIIDELDAKLHPLLLKYIIDLYSDTNINKKGAQLIFTSHDLSTMNPETFRRDEIWFIAKGDDRASKLYSLVEFKSDDGRIERKDVRYNKRYLEGRYGADPYLRKIIDWGEY